MSTAYPKTLAVKGPNQRTVRQIAETDARDVAEIGVYRGDTSLEILKVISPRGGRLEIFDFADTVRRVSKRLHAAGYMNVAAYGNSYAYLDSYCWNLGKLLHAGPRWDYVFLDGAHTWAVDGFAFLLCDRLLRPGGHIDFDDYHWTLGKSPSLRPSKFPLTRKLYTPEQIDTAQVEFVVHRLVEPLGYIEVVPRKIYRKPG